MGFAGLVILMVVWGILDVAFLLAMARVDDARRERILRAVSLAVDRRRPAPSRHAA